MDGAAIVAELEARSVGTPYLVQRIPGGVRIALNITDMQWLTFFYANGLKLGFEIDVLLDDAARSYTRQQRSRDLNYRVGSDGQVFAGEFGASVSQGTQRSFKAGFTVGMHNDGSLAKGYAFDSREITAFVDETLIRSGWKRRMDHSSKIGLIVGLGAAGVAVLGVGVAFVATVLF
jgi:hypothetical protein